MASVIGVHKGMTKDRKKERVDKKRRGMEWDKKRRGMEWVPDQ